MTCQSFVFYLQYIYPSSQGTCIFAAFNILCVIGSRFFPSVFNLFSKVCSVFDAEGVGLEFYVFTSLICCLDS